MKKSLPADTWDNLFYPPPDYTYFENSERFDFEPNAEKFSWRNAWWLADAALLAYVKDWKLATESLAQARVDQVSQIGSEDTLSTKGFFAYRSGPAPFAILAFRGTDKLDDRNARTDGDAVLIERDGYMVHRGFASALDQVWEPEVKPMLANFVKKFKGAPIYFAGHSLGAALATIAVTRFPGNNASLYTTGSPRVGDSRLAGAVLGNAKVVYRFVNCQDIVTQIPPPLPVQHSYHHAGEEKYIDRHAMVHDFYSETDKSIDLALGIIAHDGPAGLKAIGHPGKFLWQLRDTGPWVNPPPFIVGNHTPARYSVLIWNYYSGA